MRRILLLVPLVVVLLAPGSRAAAPDEHGWWTAFAGPNPDVPSDGLLVQGGASTSSPSAFGAAVYSIPDGSTVGKLTLQVTPSSASVPGSKLELCPLTSTVFEAAQGGPIANAPKFDCAKNVTAQPSSSGNTYEFDVSSFVGDGSLAIAILPTSPTDRVVFNAPSTDSLAITAPSRSAAAPTNDTPTYTTPATSSVALPPVTAATTPTTTVRPARNAAAEYVPTLAAGVTHARGAAVVLAIAGALVIGGGWLVIGRISVQRALAEGSTE